MEPWCCGEGVCSMSGLDGDVVCRPYHRHTDPIIRRTLVDGDDDSSSGDEGDIYSLFVTNRAIFEYSTSAVSVSSFRSYQDAGVLSDKCGVVLKMFNQDGDEILLVNKDFFAVVCKQFRESMGREENEYVLRAFDNMTCAVASWGHNLTPVIGEMDTSGVSNVYRVYTYFDIPYYSTEFPFSSCDERSEWCSEQTAAIAEAFRIMMKTYTYLAHKEHARKVIDGSANNLHTWRHVPAVREDATIAPGKASVLSTHFEEDAFDNIYKHIWLPRKLSTQGYGDYKLPFSFRDAGGYQKKKKKQRKIAPMESDEKSLILT